MKYLCFASKLELNYFREKYSEKNVEYILTGIASLNCYSVLNRWKIKTTFLPDDEVFYLGIAGAFEDSGLSIGDVVQVASDVLADIGAEDAKGSFLSLEEIGLDEPQQILINKNRLIQPSIKSVKGITVNRTSGCTQSIRYYNDKYKAQIETMENIGFLMALDGLEVPYYSIRSISNMIMPRDKSKWNIGLALDCLVNFMTKYKNKNYEN